MLLKGLSHKAYLIIRHLYKASASHSSCFAKSRDGKSFLKNGKGGIGGGCRRIWGSICCIEIEWKGMEIKQAENKAGMQKKKLN